MTSTTEATEMKRIREALLEHNEESPFESPSEAVERLLSEKQKTEECDKLNRTHDSLDEYHLVIEVIEGDEQDVNKLIEHLDEFNRIRDLLDEQSHVTSRESAEHTLRNLLQVLAAKDAQLKALQTQADEVEGIPADTDFEDLDMTFAQLMHEVDQNKALRTKLERLQRRHISIYQMLQGHPIAELVVESNRALGELPQRVRVYLDLAQEKIEELEAHLDTCRDHWRFKRVLELREERDELKAELERARQPDPIGEQLPEATVEQLRGETGDVQPVIDAAWKVVNFWDLGHGSRIEGPIHDDIARLFTALRTYYEGTHDDTTRGGDRDAQPRPQEAPQEAG